MSRNKYPEETVRKILDTASALFFKNGYERTSMQDIVNALGMSKGAIYHHFKSKEDLFKHVVYDFYDHDEWFREITEDPTKNGLEKLRALFIHELADEQKLSVDQIYFARMDDPRMLLENMRGNIIETAPAIAKIIEEGNRDGSMNVAMPKETAELALLMLNIWIGLFTGDKERFLTQIKMFDTVMQGLGMKLVDDEMIEIALNYYNRALLWSAAGSPNEEFWGIIPLQ